MNDLTPAQREVVETIRQAYSLKALSDCEMHCYDDPCSLDTPLDAVRLLAILDAHFPPPTQVW